MRQTLGLQSFDKSHLVAMYVITPQGDCQQSFDGPSKLARKIWVLNGNLAKVDLLGEKGGG